MFNVKYFKRSESLSELLENEKEKKTYRVPFQLS